MAAWSWSGIRGRSVSAIMITTERDGFCRIIAIRGFVSLSFHAERLHRGHDSCHPGRDGRLFHGAAEPELRRARPGERGLRRGDGSGLVWSVSPARTVPVGYSLRHSESTGWEWACGIRGAAISPPAPFSLPRWR